MKQNRIKELKKSEDRELIVNLILKNTDKHQFLELKQQLGITKPNTQIITECIRLAYKMLVF